MQKVCLKRFFDLVLSLTGIIISMPLWILIGLLIWLEDGTPVFYSQYRIGKQGKLFRFMKFRSMVKTAERQSGRMWSDKDDARITRAGRILRATAMDELPQLINILRGDMSFVGPRPERPQFVKKFKKEILSYEKRFIIRPGLTGMAQVYGHYNTSPAKKLKYDLEYIERMNFILDLKLIFLSLFTTLCGGWTRFEEK